MTKYLNLKVPSSCNENWNNMIPELGRSYCLSCQKSVIDFTAMTDSELIQYFKEFNGSTCGRFTESQLNRNIPLPKKPLPWVKYFFNFALPVFLLSLKSSVNGQKATQAIELMPVKPEANVVDTTIRTLPIIGVVSDEAGTPVAGASIQVKRTNKGTVTDGQGAFVLTEVVVPSTLVVSYVGYQSKEVRIASVHQGMQIKLSLTPAVMGEVIVVGYISPKRVARREMKKNKKQEHTSTTSSSILTYPNPVISESKLNVQCRSLEKGIYTAEIFTLSGQLVQASKITYSNEGSHITLAMGSMLSGTYLLQLTHEKSGKQVSQQIVVRK